MIEAWKTKLNSVPKVGVIYLDLPEAFDSLNHELLISKLICCGLDEHAVEFFRSYPSNRYQCCKINNLLTLRLEKSFSRFTTKIFTGSLLFNMFLNDIFFFLRDAGLINYADDSTLYVYNENLENNF